MAISDLVSPYEFATDLGPPLSEWERSEAAITDKFRELFPDGVVPIRHIPTLGADFETPSEWAETLLSIFEAAHSFDMDRLDALASEWHLLPEDSDELGRVTRELLALGLSMRQLARWLRVEPIHVARAYAGHRGDEYTTLEADDLVSDTTLTGDEVAARTGLSKRTVNRLRQARGISLPRGRPKKRVIQAA